jgi:hypothetical protein
MRFDMNIHICRADSSGNDYITIRLNIHIYRVRCIGFAQQNFINH